MRELQQSLLNLWRLIKSQIWVWFLLDLCNLYQNTSSSPLKPYDINFSPFHGSNSLISTKKIFHQNPLHFHSYFNSSFLKFLKSISTHRTKKLSQFLFEFWIIAKRQILEAVQIDYPDFEYPLVRNYLLRIVNEMKKNT